MREYQEILKVELERMKAQKQNLARKNEDIKFMQSKRAEYKKTIEKLRAALQKSGAVPGMVPMAHEKNSTTAPCRNLLLKWRS